MVDARLLIAGMIFAVGLNAAVYAWGDRDRSSFTIPEGKVLRCEMVDR